MREKVLEADAIEEPAGADGGVSAGALAVPTARTDLTPLRGEARTVAIAAAGGVVVGAATVAIAKAASRVSAPSKRSRRTLTGRRKPNEVVASRSFLVDVHLLGR